MSILDAVEASRTARLARTAERIAAGMKHCPRCGETRPLDAFSYCPSRRGDQRQSYCRACDSARVWERYLARTHSHPADVASAADGLAVTRQRSQFRELAASAIMSDPSASDSKIAALIGSGTTTVSTARRKLEAAGLIEPRPPRPQRARPVRVPAVVLPAPRPPDWSQGLCTRVDSQHRLFWSSDIEAERQAAMLMCQSCPVLTECERYAVAITDAHVSNAVWLA